MKKDNVIMLISDLHAPYQHKDALAFLAKIKEKYSPKRIINLGDEVDYHALSFHASDPDLDSAGVELERAKAVMRKLKELFPKMDLLHSNHGSMVYRKAKVGGIPRHALKSYNEVLNVDDQWVWHSDLTITTEKGKVYFCHGKKKNSETYAKSLGCSVVQGHYHEDFRIGYLKSPGGTIWGMNIGCLIDDKELAFEYNKINPNKPMLGTAVIINGIPKLIPMNLDDKGNWDNEII